MDRRNFLKGMSVFAAAVPIYLIAPKQKIYTIEIPSEASTYSNTSVGGGVSEDRGEVTNHTRTIDYTKSEKVVGVDVLMSSSEMAIFSEIPQQFQLLDRKIFPPIILTSGDSLQLNYKLTGFQPKTIYLEPILG